MVKGAQFAKAIHRVLKLNCFLFIAVIFLVVFCSLAQAEINTKQEAGDSAFPMQEAATQPDLSAGAVMPAPARYKLDTEVVEEDEEAVIHELDSYFRYMPTRSLVSQPGKISVMKMASEYTYSFKAFAKLPIELSISGEDVDINANDAVPVSLPSHLTSLNFGAETTLPFFNINKTFLRLGITPGFYSSNWNFKANSFNFGSHMFLIYQPSEAWTFIAGIAANPGFEDSILPIAGLIFKPNDKLTFDLIPDRPTISFKFNERLTVYAEGGFSGGEFKVSKDNVRGAALSYNEVHAGGGAKFKVNKYIDTYLSCGRMFNHYLKYRDSLGKVDMKNNIYSEFRVEMRI